MLPLAAQAGIERQVPLALASNIVAACVGLGATRFGGPLSAAECSLVEASRSTSVAPSTLKLLRDLITSGADPLGDAISRLRTPTERRRRGAIYTPSSVVQAICDWGLSKNPIRVVDPGCGSGRFASFVARSNPSLEILAIDVDPLATLTTRAALVCCGAKNARVLNADFVLLELSKIRGRTAFLGNPPYVRHHDLTQSQKRVGKALARTLNLKLSGLAGLHVYFLLAALRSGSVGDLACFITSAEWLDVGYGQVVRDALLTKTTGISLHVMRPRETVFQDTMTTALITCAEMGQGDDPVRFRSLRSLSGLHDMEKGGRYLSRETLTRSHRWGALARNGIGRVNSKMVRLGDIVRVSRGAVTGCNRFFLMAKPDVDRLGLAKYVVRVATSAKEVLEAQGDLRPTPGMCFLLDPPRETKLTLPEHERLRTYLDLGERNGHSRGYICSHRTPWWHVGAKTPPIVATYMTRQAPAFALNQHKLAIINVIHGLYPRVFMNRQQLKILVACLNAHRDRLRGAGRTYHGGLEKFEPSEMEALEFPLPPGLLAELAV